MPERFDLSTPANQRKLAACGPCAARGGCGDRPFLTWRSASALTIQRSPSAIVGPRTVDQLTGLLGAVTVTLDEEVLDRIDEIVAPGTTVNPADHDHLAPIGLRDKADRRRTR